MSTPATPTQARPAGSWSTRGSDRESLPLTSLSEVAQRLLSAAPLAAQPMISRAGVRDEARRVRSILRATIDDRR
jgi:hypothetical protein